MALKRSGSTDSSKQRQASIRSCAEVLRLLAVRPQFDDEAQDMAAFLVFNLRNIYTTINESVQAWDDRNYWKKAEETRQKWRWSKKAAEDLEALILANRWAQVPEFLILLIPYFSDVTIREITRNADWWVGALRALKERKPFEV